MDCVSWLTRTLKKTPPALFWCQLKLQLWNKTWLQLRFLKNVECSHKSPKNSEKQSKCCSREISHPTDEMLQTHFNLLCYGEKLVQTYSIRRKRNFNVRYICSVFLRRLQHSDQLMWMFVLRTDAHLVLTQVLLMPLNGQWTNGLFSCNTKRNRVSYQCKVLSFRFEGVINAKCVFLVYWKYSTAVLTTISDVNRLPTASANTDDRLNCCLPVLNSVSVASVICSCIRSFSFSDAILYSVFFDF